MLSNICFSTPVKTKSEYNMIIDYKTCTAYICPACSSLTEKDVNIFDFSSNEKTIFRCSDKHCNEECVNIRKKNNKYIINIPCSLCGSNHSFTISAERFWDKKPFTLSCPLTGIEIFFTGEKSKAHDFAMDFGEIISDCLGEDDLILDILSDMTELIYELEFENRIACVCGSEDVEIGMCDSGIILTCKKCHKSKILEPTEETLIKLESANSVIIG